MINFLKISNSIKVGDYLHCDGTIDDKVSFDMTGVCVIPSNFLPDGLARFMSFRTVFSRWNKKILVNCNYKRKLPGKNIKELDGGYYNIFGGSDHFLISPYLSDGQFNSDFLKDLPQGNAFQDYKGYENTELYREKYGDSEDLNNAFSRCLSISPLYRKSEWYLPSIGELALLYEKQLIINRKICLATNTNSSEVISGNYYWSSSESSFRSVWGMGMYSGSIYYSSKSSNGCVCSFLAL